MAHWWGPHGFTAPVWELDVRPGGALRIEMRGPDGTVYPKAGDYREFVGPEPLVFASAVLFEVPNTVTFAEQDGKTTLGVQARVVQATAGAASFLAGMHAGWCQQLEGLEAFLA